MRYLKYQAHRYIRYLSRLAKEQTDLRDTKKDEGAGYVTYRFLQPADYRGR